MEDDETGAEEQFLFPEIPKDFAALSDEELQTFIDATKDAIEEVASNPNEFVTEDVSTAEVFAATKEASEALAAARAVQKERVEAATQAEPELSDEEFTEGLAEFAKAAKQQDEEEAEGDEEGTAETGDEEEEAVTASAEPEPKQRRLPAPSRSRRPAETAEERVSLIAAADVPGFDKGDAFPSMEDIAAAMQARRRNFGLIPEGTSGEKVPIVRSDWSHLYPTERKLGDDALINEGKIANVTDPERIRDTFEKRKNGEKALVASGGLCAPVTPYYQLMMVSQAARPVRAALPSFNADRGGIRAAAPATLATITTGVGVKTAAQDAAGGTTAQKTCQVVSCPPFTETDVQIIFHCLQFGNLGARTFPERVTQWNNLTLAAHARLAETQLLNGIDNASTQVTAASLGLGASADLFSQISTACVGMKSRHRMDDGAVLRILLPWWSVYLLISDVERSQFDRWSMDAAKVTSLLRQINVEPSFYMDSAAGRNQVYGTQSAGALLPFPSNVVWYLFPEGSFLYLDGGTLELGLVRDSVLNATNDFQIFGETFENVAYVGVESMAVSSITCDVGMTAGVKAIACPVSYAGTT